MNTIKRFFSCTVLAASLIASDETLVIKELSECEQKELRSARQELEKAKQKLDEVTQKIKRTYGESPSFTCELEVELRGKYAMITSNPYRCITASDLVITGDGTTLKLSSPGTK
jgi:hypothetical protein